LESYFEHADTADGQELSAEFQQLFTGSAMCFFQLMVKTALTGSFVRRKSREEHVILMQQFFSGVMQTCRIVFCKGHAQSLALTV